MRYHYGNFFGVTAVHLMFMTESEINRIFDITATKSDTKLMLKNLYTEVEALRTIFSSTPTEGIPHIVLTKDNSAPEVAELISGFNAFLAQKSEPVVSLDTGTLDMSALDSFTAEESAQAAESTSLFSGDDFSFETFGEADKSSESDFSFDSIFNSQEEDEENTAALNGQSIDYSNLIELGKASHDVEQKVHNILQLSRYLLTHKNEFSAEENESIMQQIADLPKVPSTVELPRQFTSLSKPLSSQSISILTSLYEHMTRMVKPKNSKAAIPFAEYVSEKLKMLLTSKISTVKQLYFVSQSMFSTDLSLVRWHDIVLDLNNTYLSQKHVSAILGNIEALIADCNEVLGRTSNKKETQQITEFSTLSREYLELLAANSSSTEIDAKFAEWGDKLLELLGRTAIPENYQAQTITFFDTLLRSDKLFPLLNNISNLRMLAYINVAMYRVVTSEFGSRLNRQAFSSIDNSDISTVVQICSPIYKEFTLETGIMGFQCNYEPKLLRTLNEVITPLDQSTNIQFQPESVNYKLSALLRKHLKSLQKRLYNYR